MKDYIILGIVITYILYVILQHPFPRFFYGELPRLIIDSYFGTNYHHEYLCKVDKEYRNNIAKTPGFDGWTGESL